MKTTLAVILLIAAKLAIAEMLPAADAELIESAGIPIHADVMFVYGNSSVGFRFASNKPVDEIRSWYIEQLAEWSVMDDFGLWSLYDGPEGASFGDLMSTNQVIIADNEDLPGWHSLDDDMTTEIVIMLGK